MIIRTTRTIRIRKTNPTRIARTARRTALQILLTAKTTTKRTTNFSGFGEKAPKCGCLFQCRFGCQKPCTTVFDGQSHKRICPNSIARTIPMSLLKRKSCSAVASTIFESHLHRAKVICPNFFWAIGQIKFIDRAFGIRILYKK